MMQAGHTPVGWVEWDKFARKSYEAIHQPEGEWTAHDIRTVRASELPKADCWCFGFPCQDISVAGKQKGLTAGKRSSLFFTVTGLIRDLEEEDRPSYLLIENVKNLLSINRGFDFLKLQIELDEIGYDCEWDVLDSAEVVPQHRERIFIVGHLRGRSTRKVFPIIRKGGKTNTAIKEVAKIYKDRHSSDGNSVIDTSGISPTITAHVSKDAPKALINQVGNISESKSFNGNQQVGGQEPKVLTKAKSEFGRMGQQAIETVNSNNVTPGDTINPYFMKVDKSKVSPTLTTRPEGMKTAILPITKDLRIRKLTPRECWILQGFPDWAFDRAKQAGLSDSQLYKQSGNSVTVPVIKMIAERFAVKK